MEEGKGVLVAAPTGSGKTVVGEFAVHLALETGRKCFYTTPIKALSNQKYHDLVARYGADRVGLLTGDTSVNGEAPVVVMTTEVLRNMLYAGSGTLTGLGYVVMDEVHYLADRSRGAVWEEVIIHLPESVALVSLSATVSNAEEFGEWLETVRGDTDTLVEERRPVPLYQHVLVGKRMMDLFATSDVDAAAGFVKEGAPVNAELLRIARDDWASTRMRDRRTPKGRARSAAARRPVGNGRRVWIPSRVDVLDRLDGAGLLPAIVFIFSRVGCDAAVAAVPALGDPADDARRSATRSSPTSRRRAPTCPTRTVHVLGYHDFLDGLTRGVAAHHAGMLPAFKQCVEQLFVRGLCKAVFATETLALGHQHAGPHGGPREALEVERRDARRHHAGGVHPADRPRRPPRPRRRGARRRALAAGHEPRRGRRARLDPYLSAALELPPVVQHGGQPRAPGRPVRARELLEMSFAQFQADKAVVGLARQLDEEPGRARRGTPRPRPASRGDFMEYAALRQRVSELEKDAARARQGRPARGGDRTPWRGCTAAT